MQARCTQLSAELSLNAACLGMPEAQAGWVPGVNGKRRAVHKLAASKPGRGGPSALRILAMTSQAAAPYLIEEAGLPELVLDLEGSKAANSCTCRGVADFADPPSHFTGQRGTHLSPTQPGSERRMACARLLGDAGEAVSLHAAWSWWQMGAAASPERAQGTRLTLLPLGSRRHAQAERQVVYTLFCSAIPCRLEASRQGRQHSIRRS